MNTVPTKEKQLLIYMLYAEGTDFTFTLSGHADILISRGMTSSKNALSAMLNTLKNKGFVTNTNNRGEWVLTESGRDEAMYWINQCCNSTVPSAEDDPEPEDEQPHEEPVDDQPAETSDEHTCHRDEAVDYWLDVAAKFLQRAAKFLNGVEIRIY